MSSTKKHGLSDSAAVTFRNETCDILCHCNPHNATHAPETTHLVVGYVQSGKTMSFTGLTALALDNGYRVVIYLAGTKNNLLDQTSKRLKKDLIGNRAKTIITIRYILMQPLTRLRILWDILNHQTIP